MKKTWFLFSFLAWAGGLSINSLKASELLLEPDQENPLIFKIKEDLESQKILVRFRVVNMEEENKLTEGYGFLEVDREIKPHSFKALSQVALKYLSDQLTTQLELKGIFFAVEQESSHEAINDFSHYLGSTPETDYYLLALQKPDPTEEFETIKKLFCPAIFQETSFKK